MRFVFTKQLYSWDFGFYITNWGYPIGNEWEVGINLGKWIFGIELYK
jgi:hypothetical protein